MKKAVIYARYSSERQTEQSIEGQLHVCNDYAAHNDIVVVDTYIDRAMTGTNDNRAAFQKMMRDASKRLWDYVLVYKLDRFSRNKYEMAIHRKALKDNGIKILSAMENIPDSPEGIILESMLEGMAEYYSAELSQKIRRGLKESRLKGQFSGGTVPLGYKKMDKRLYEDEDSANIVRFIFEQYARGTFVKDISAQLAERGILQNGQPFPLNTIYKILKNEKYIGICHYNGVEYDNIFPPLVSREVYDIVQAKVDENKKGKHINEDVYLLKGKAICGYCGKTMSSDSGTARNGTVKRYYKCQGKKKGSKCEKCSIRKEVLEGAVIDTTVKVLSDPETLSAMADMIIEANNKYAADTTIINMLEQELSETEKSIKNLLNALEQGIVTSSTKQRLLELEDERGRLETKIAVERNKEFIFPTKQEILKYIRTSLKKNAQIMIRILVHHIVVYDDKIQIYYNFTNKQKPDSTSEQVFSFYQTTVTGEIDMHQHRLPNNPNGWVVPYSLNMELFLLI